MNNGLLEDLDVDWTAVGQTVGQLVDAVTGSSDGTTTTDPPPPPTPSVWESIAPMAAVGAFALAVFAIMRKG